MALTLTGGVGFAYAQGTPTDQDKKFLQSTAQDTNYEIKTGQLALKKSPSADVKQYATMVVHDHEALEPVIGRAYAAAKEKPVGPNDFSVGDRARYTELEVLTGKAFDDAYIKGLIKGNQETVNDAKSEAAGSQFTPIKNLAERNVALDTKHTQRAEALAQAHHIDAK